MHIDPVRFWSKVKKGPGCWVWTAGTNGGGYGAFGIRGSMRPAHRIAWELTYGSIPKGKRILHHCDNRPCVRPKHLFCGTQKHNIRDAIRKGRFALGERTRNNKVTEKHVLEIRSRYAAGEIQRKLAREFMMTPSGIFEIVHRLVWKHV